jgi:hypothetical protein
LLQCSRAYLDFCLLRQTKNHAPNVTREFMPKFQSVTTAIASSFDT